MTDSLITTLTAARRAIQSASALVDGLTRLPPSAQTDHIDTLFERTLTTSLTGHDAVQMLPLIVEATGSGHTCILELADDDGDLDIVWRVGTEPAISGDPEFVIDPGERNNLRRLLDSGDVRGTLSMLEARKFNLRASLRFRGRGIAWVPSPGLLISSLTCDAWLSTLIQLWQCSDDGHLTVLVNELDQLVETQGITFAPSAQVGTLARVPASEAQSQGSEFAEARVSQGWPDVPLPTKLVPDPSDGGDLAAALVSVALATAWMWLSVDPPVVQRDSVVVRYRGVRDVEITLAPTDVARDQLAQALALWRWAAAAGDDPVRTDATQRAITLAAAELADLPAAGGPALRTARTLYDLATRGAIAEAMAARRAGRDAAATAAHKAATGAREAAGKATERSLTLTIAAAVVVFATVQKVLAWYVSVGALAGLAFLLIGGLLVAVKVDLAIASDLLDGFEEDLGDYRESLSEDDIQQIRQSAAVRHARRNITSARTAVVRVYSICALAAIGLALGFIVVRPG